MASSETMKGHKRPAHLQSHSCHSRDTPSSSPRDGHCINALLMGYEDGSLLIELNHTYGWNKAGLLQTIQNATLFSNPLLCGITSIRWNQPRSVIIGIPMYWKLAKVRLKYCVI